MKLTSHLTPSKRKPFAFTFKRFAKSNLPIAVQKFVASVKARISANPKFRIMHNHKYRNSMSVIEKETERMIVFKTTFHQNRNWAILTVKWIGNEPGLQDLDKIKEAFFGDIYTVIHLRFEVQPHEALIVHCLSDAPFPGGNGDS